MTKLLGYMFSACSVEYNVKIPSPSRTLEIRPAILTIILAKAEKQCYCENKVIRCSFFTMKMDRRMGSLKKKAFHISVNVHFLA